MFRSYLQGRIQRDPNQVFHQRAAAKAAHTMTQIDSVGVRSNPAEGTSNQPPQASMTSFHDILTGTMKSPKEELQNTAITDVPGIVVDLTLASDESSLVEEGEIREPQQNHPAITNSLPQGSQDNGTGSYLG